LPPAFGGRPIGGAKLRRWKLPVNLIIKVFSSLIEREPDLAAGLGTRVFSGLLTFSLAAYRFFFEALEPVRFPAGSAGNAFRGAFGHILRRIACRDDCPGAKSCARRLECAYARLFEPVCLEGPSGLADAPRPFVIRASGLDGRNYDSGETFWIDVHVFDLRQPVIPYLTAAMAALAEEGIGAARGRVRLGRVHSLDERGDPAACLYRDGCWLDESPAPPIMVSLDPCHPAGAQALTVQFLTPTELKNQGRVLAGAPFAVVFARARDRVSTLRALYGDGPLDIDFRGMAQRAAAVETLASQLQWVRAERRSSRTGQVHPLGGFVGEVRYRGLLGEFLPFLEAARWTGIGRQTVWGKGAISLRHGN